MSNEHREVPFDDRELARRSLLGFGEMFAAFGTSCEGPGAEVRQPDAVGARVDVAVHNPFFSSAVVPLGAAPPTDSPELPHYLWTVADSVPGRVEEPESATPCMGLVLDDFEAPRESLAPEVVDAPLAVLGELNERAYGETGFGALARALDDDRARVRGLRSGGELVCVAMGLAVDGDLGIHYVATEESHRRRGLATALVGAMLAAAKAAGMRTATLQSSEDGFSVWERLGFRTVASVRGFLRPSNDA